MSQTGEETLVMVSLSVLYWHGNFSLRRNIMENKVPVRFFVVTFLWSWLFFGLAILFAGDSQDLSEMIMSPGIDFLLVLIGVFGPAIGAFVSLYTLEGKGAIKNYLKLFLSLRFGWKAWLSIILVLGGSSIIAWIIPEFLGEARIEAHLPNIYIFPIYILAMIFLGGGQEELGWQGYILPRLEKRFGLIIGGLILGIVWAVWHLPLWFIPGTSQIFMNFFGFMLVTIGYAYFFSWIVKESGNRLFSGLVVHGFANAFAALFPFLIMEHGVIQMRFWIHVLLTFIIGIIVVATRTYKNRKIQEIKL
jgi:membrane protease YdiL (CAAX protease family)